MSDPTATVVATFPDATPVQPSLFAQMLEGADYIDGHTLERSKENLLGVPFVITGVVVRDGVSSKEFGKQNYWSVELVVADAITLDDMMLRGRLTVDQRRRVTPNEQLVINDGSTGIARQVCAWLHAKGWITVPEGPDGGPMGTSRYDAYRTKWQYRDGLEFGIDPQTGNTIDTAFKPIRLACLRGLRKSDYDTEFSADGAATYYLA